MLGSAGFFLAPPTLMPPEVSLGAVVFGAVPQTHFHTCPWEAVVCWVIVHPGEGQTLEGGWEAAGIKGNTRNRPPRGLPGLHTLVGLPGPGGTKAPPKPEGRGRRAAAPKPGGA